MRRMYSSCRELINTTDIFQDNKVNKFGVASVTPKCLKSGPASVENPAGDEGLRKPTAETANRIKRCILRNFNLIVHNCHKKLRFGWIYVKIIKNTIFWKKDLTKLSFCDIIFRRSRENAICGCSSMVEFQPSKLITRVRFPSPAPLYVPLAQQDRATAF